MVDLFPGGFEEVQVDDVLELAAYTDGKGEERLRGAFRGSAVVARVEPGWEDAWRDFHRAIQIGPLWIGPPWEDARADLTALVIDPGRAFGTGAHPTTQLCVEFLLGERPASLVDIGCGSGVIAIAGAKLGFSPVVALDLDPIAVSVARTNAAVNGVDVEVCELDATRSGVPTTIVAVANIGRAELEKITPQLRAERLIISGYQVGDRPKLESWRVLRGRSFRGWAANLYEPL